MAVVDLIVEGVVSSGTGFKMKLSRQTGDQPMGKPILVRSRSWPMFSFSCCFNSMLTFSGEVAVGMDFSGLAAASVFAFTMVSACWATCARRVGLW